MWECPECRRRFGRTNQGHECAPAMDIEEYFETGPEFERPVFEVVRAHMQSLDPDIWFEPVSVGFFFKRRTTFLQLRTMTKWVAVCFNLDRRLSSDRLARKVLEHSGRHYHVGQCPRRGRDRRPAPGVVDGGLGGRRLMLHGWWIDAAQYERHEQRRGRRHAFERLDPTRTALVVVDLVPFFVDENPYAAGILANVNRLAAALRAVGGTVAWVVPADVPPPPTHMEFFGPRVASLYADSGGSGSVQDRLAAELEPREADLFVEKSAASAFFPGRCPLHDLLQQHSIENVIVVGTLANVCCESTVRDANTLGYRVVMVADANAAGSDAELNATLHTVYRSFGDVRPTDEVIGLLS